MKGYIRKTIEFYDRNVEEYIRNTRKLPEKKWLKMFVSCLPEKSRVLDLGCAFGRDCKFFIDKGFETHGADLSSKLIEKARETVKGVKFYVMDLINLKFKQDYFDGVWCSATLVHLKKEDIPEALIEIRRVLKKGGVLYLSLKEGTGEKLIKDERYGGAEKFYSYFTENEIKDLLAKNNFKLLRFKMFFFKDKYRKDAGRIRLIARKGL
jgi:ubiquinone/menaquinone biosynthesis C-methylase UbiE